MLIVVISVMLYYYIKVTVFETAVQELSYEAKHIEQNINSYNPENLSNFIIQIPNKIQTSVEIKRGELGHKNSFFKVLQENGKSYTTLTYQYNDSEYMVLKKETTLQHDIVEQIFLDIIIVNSIAILLVIFYAMFLSRMLLIPIKILTSKLTKIDEKFLKEIEEDEKFPDEFSPLLKSINKLITRIQTFVEYQKELFVGVAHELKTPLAVMKTKNEVTLLKDRESERYIEALKSNNESINNMNAMISSILEIGRQEGAQFEEPISIDIISFLQKLGNNFAILARGEGKDIILSLEPRILNLKIQTTLLTHVIQNFVQNAIKFSPQSSNILINSYISDANFIIEVIDEGIGIDESKDLFAPFKRFGDKGGAGLGLFLAKGAAQALGGSISIKNRCDRSGAIATLVLPMSQKKSTSKAKYKK
ncbi:HAMP domain-containing histidine kinase [Campylobacter sp. faydin G-24]|uniref:histidine kinase n=1 Tax=Campylobacter anatolicus TaxID=2829105 RepID=A0ABS5HH17_9BACT|nr:HAMP domain-containing sensor histidine kinase [Campylobacter anatolicus]MBR8463569.1 HAMP domain-containing histidine kinase [Campylobacter anatolicus]